MASILELLYEGALRPEEKIIPKTQEYKACAKKYDEIYTSCFARLEPYEKTDYLELEEAKNCLVSLEVKEAFLVGFQTGVRILLEAGIKGNS